jgi:hypothetical protein
VCRGGLRVGAAYGRCAAALLAAMKMAVARTIPVLLLIIICCGATHPGPTMALNISASALPPRKTDDSGAAAPPPASVYVGANPLKDLAPLQKPHFSWALPKYYLNGSDPNFVDGVVHDYVRITGACPLDMLATKTVVTSCVEICLAVTPQRAKAGLPAPTINLVYSPWYVKFSRLAGGTGKDPTVTGPPEAAELQYYTAKLKALKAWMQLAHDNGGSSPTIELGAVILDMERWGCEKHDSEEHCAAVTRKSNLIYNATRSVFPSSATRIEMYARGEMAKAEWYTDYTAYQPCGTPTPCESKAAIDAWNVTADELWFREPFYTLHEIGESFTITLYRLQEVELMRERMSKTVALAKQLNDTGATTTYSVNPWIALGCGFRRQANHSYRANGSQFYDQAMVFDTKWDYDRVASWTFGSEINRPWYGAAGRELMFAPWR